MQPEDVIDFWFEETDPKLWFEKNDDFDATIRSRFLPQVEAALDGTLDDWTTNDAGAMALVILLDQFTRNLFRGSSRSFAGDEKALAITLERLGERARADDAFRESCDLKMKSACSELERL